MDKRQRKALSKWENKKQKDNERLERLVRKQFQEDAYEQIAKFSATYKTDLSMVFSSMKDITFTFNLGYHRYVPIFYHGGMWDIVFDDHKLERVVNVEKSIAKVKQRIDGETFLEYAYNFNSQRERTAVVRDELIEKADKFRAIRNCRDGFKEELMMAVWHPRKVQRILETYGWDVLENLMGVD